MFQQRRSSVMLHLQYLLLGSATLLLSSSLTTTSLVFLLLGLTLVYFLHTGNHDSQALAALVLVTVLWIAWTVFLCLISAISVMQVFERILIILADVSYLAGHLRAMDSRHFCELVTRVVALLLIPMLYFQLPPFSFSKLLETTQATFLLPQTYLCLWIGISCLMFLVCLSALPRRWFAQLLAVRLCLCGCICGTAVAWATALADHAAGLTVCMVIWVVTVYCGYFLSRTRHIAYVYLSLCLFILVGLVRISYSAVHFELHHLDLRVFTALEDQINIARSVSLSLGLSLLAISIRTHINNEYGWLVVHRKVMIVAEFSSFSLWLALAMTSLPKACQIASIVFLLWPQPPRTLLSTYMFRSGLLWWLFGVVASLSELNSSLDQFGLALTSLAYLRFFLHVRSYSSALLSKLTDYLMWYGGSLLVVGHRLWTDHDHGFSSLELMGAIALLLGLVHWNEERIRWRQHERRL